MARRGWILGAPWQACVALVLVAYLFFTREPGGAAPWWRTALVACAAALLLWGFVVRARGRRGAG